MCIERQPNRRGAKPILQQRKTLATKRVANSVHHMLHSLLNGLHILVQLSYSPSQAQLSIVQAMRQIHASYQTGRPICFKLHLLKNGDDIIISLLGKGLPPAHSHSPAITSPVVSGYRWRLPFRQHYLGLPLAHKPIFAGGKFVQDFKKSRSTQRRPKRKYN
jgi:hypothetical protein